MLWVIQKNLLNDGDFWRFTMALDELSINWKPISIIPFSDELELPDGVKNPVVFYGSTSLMRQLKKHPELTPAMWVNDNFDYLACIKHYGSHMVNGDATFHQFKDIPEFEGVRFIRPRYDTKLFTGTLVGGDEFLTWKNNVLNSHIHMFADSEVMVASPKNIRYEYRFFVVKGKVVTGSLYHVDDRLSKKNVDDDADVNAVMARQFAQARVNEWQPADVFVMDIGLIKNDVGELEGKIVEINTFNCSGFYESDVKKIIQAIENM